MFYFQPGHESYPTFYDENVKTVLRNAVRWAAPTARLDKLESPHIKETMIIAPPIKH